MNGLEFDGRQVYKRRAEIVASIDLHFSGSEWLNIIEVSWFGKMMIDDASKVRPTVREWCAENLKAPYAFGRYSIHAASLAHVHLHVTSEIDAILFKMRWF